jgi:hypothetical protein
VRRLALLAQWIAIALALHAHLAIGDDSAASYWANYSAPGSASPATTNNDSPLSLWLQNLAPNNAPAAASDDSPPALWADRSAPKTVPSDAATGESPHELWTRSPATDDVALASASDDAPLGAWAGSAPPASDLPTIAPGSTTPSDSFWTSVNQGYRWLKPKPYGGKGYPGWGPGATFQPTESAFYARLDYYHWTERYGGVNLLDERGPLYTVGYTLTGGEQRFRAELFTGVVQYQGSTFGGSGPSLLLDNHTTYYGGRVEYDLFFNCPNNPNGLMFIGLGTRVWHRSLPSVTLPGNIFVQGYGETWVTLYPYIGVETRHDPCKTLEFYGRMRVGATAYTHNRAGIPLDETVIPRAGATALLEEGFRYRDFTATIWTEVFGFSQSHVNTQGYLQPMSTLLTVGAKAGYSF